MVFFLFSKLTNNPTVDISPHTWLFVAYCIKIWCMLWTCPRSTRHSAVDLINADAVHSPPYKAKFDFFPSTARLEEYFASIKGCSCHVDFPKARFSAKHKQLVLQQQNISQIYESFVCRYINTIKHIRFT